MQQSCHLLEHQYLELKLIKSQQQHRRRINIIKNWQPEPEFTFNSKNLLMVSGKTKRKYALNVAKELFTKDELENGVIMDGNRVTKRTPLSPVRVLLLKRCAI
jgi:hypothetical protein